MNTDSIAKQTVRLIDSCISKPIRENYPAKDLYKVRSLVVTAAFFTLLSLTSVIAQLSLSGSYTSTAIVPTISIFTSLSILLQVKLLSSHKIPLLAMQVFFVILLPMAIIENGTVLSPPMFCLPIVPMLFSILANLKRGLALFTLCFIISIIGLSFSGGNPYLDTSYFEERSFAGLVSVFMSSIIIIGLAYTSDRLSQLVEENLKEQIDRSEKSEQMKTRFLANISHEIRTPLNNVIGHSELLRDRLAIHDFSHFHIENIFRSSRQLVDIISNVIEASRLDINAYEFTTEEADLPKLMYEYGKSFTEEAEAKGLNITFNFAPELRHHSIELPKEAFGKIIYHLLSNATKFTSAGKIAVDVDYDHVGSKLILAITDSGVGIDEETLSSIFDKFLQGNEEMTREFGGLGLGLAITKTIIDNISGDISIQSQPQVGTTFTVKIPAHLKPRNNPNRASIVKVHVIDPTSLIAEYISIESSKMPFTTDRYADIATISDAAIDDNDIILIHNNQGEAQLVKAVNLISEKSPNSIILVHGNELNQFSSRGDYRYIVLNHLDDFMKYLPSFEPSKCQIANSTPITEEKPRKILIVDDAEDNRALMKLYLETHGFETMMAADGIEAVEAAKNESFDLILMDIQMPNMDGFEATAKIKEWEDRFIDKPKTPIVIVTAHDIEEHRDQCKKLETAGFITKPLRKKSFVKEVNTVFVEYDRTRGAA